MRVFLGYGYLAIRNEAGFQMGSGAVLASFERYWGAPPLVTLIGSTLVDMHGRSVRIPSSIGRSVVTVVCFSSFSTPHSMTQTRDMARGDLIVRAAVSPKTSHLALGLTASQCFLSAACFLLGAWPPCLGESERCGGLPARRRPWGQPPSAKRRFRVKFNGKDSAGGGHSGPGRIARQIERRIWRWISMDRGGWISRRIRWRSWRWMHTVSLGNLQMMPPPRIS